MTIPNISTIYFLQKHKNFPVRFEWFGTELARIGTGNCKIRNPKEIPSGEQQTNMIMDYVSQASLT